MENISEFLIFCKSLGKKIITRYEKRGKYLPILHEATRDNYFIVKYLLKSNVARVIVLTYQLYQAFLI